MTDDEIDAACERSIARAVERLSTEPSDASRLLEILKVALDECRRLVNIPLPPTAWRPIETAPKDGTRVSLCSHSGNVASGYWEHYTTSWWDWPFSFEEPTRWMPLPAPPKEAT